MKHGSLARTRTLGLLLENHDMTDSLSSPNIPCCLFHEMKMSLYLRHLKLITSLQIMSCEATRMDIRQETHEYHVQQHNNCTGYLEKVVFRFEGIKAMQRTN